MLDRSKVRKEALISALPRVCREECTLAKYAIAEVCRDSEANWRSPNLDAGRVLLPNCIDGPMLVGTCGTEKKVCAHTAVDTTTDTLEQARLFINALSSL